jgi:hypothetical protein
MYVGVLDSRPRLELRLELRVGSRKAQKAGEMWWKNLSSWLLFRL